MREYISKKLGISKSLYNRVKSLIGDYDRMKRERLDILYGGGRSITGMPKGNNISNPTQDKAIKLALLDGDITAIDQACMVVRGAYSDKVQDTFDPIKAYYSYNYFSYMYIRTDDNITGPSKSTWVRYKYALTKVIVEQMNW